LANKNKNVHPNLTSLTAFFKGSNVPTEAGLLLTQRSNLARCPSCHNHQWLIWVSAAAEPRFPGHKYHEVCCLNHRTKAVL